MTTDTSFPLTEAAKALSGMGPAFVGGMTASQLDEYLVAVEHEAAAAQLQAADAQLAVLRSLLERIDNRLTGNLLYADLALAINRALNSTAEELGRDIYLGMIALDDELSDSLMDRLPIKKAAVLWARLRGPYCEHEGCTNLHTESFPWCIDHLAEGPRAAHHQQGGRE